MKNNIKRILLENDLAGKKPRTQTDLAGIIYAISGGEGPDASYLNRIVNSQDSGLNISMATARWISQALDLPLDDVFPPAEDQANAS